MTTPLATLFAAFEHTPEQTPDRSTPADNLALFADTFLAAGPDGARAVPRAAFAPALARRRQILEEHGLKSNRLVSLEETPLAPRYALARARWQMTFAPSDRPAEEFTVDSTYLVDTEARQILVYLTYQDIFALLRERGILPTYRRSPDRL